ncbi:MAG: VOC family protein [Candidatus Hydrogenedentes bacterium]|nr:VOC family protein [Candidatus Hydrogenedentota bacterium]
MRFEVFLNGERKCTADLDVPGMLFADVNYFHCSPDALAINRQRNPDFQERHLRFHVSRLEDVEGYSASSLHRDYLSSDLQPGDEVTIRILPAGKCDEPIPPGKTMDEILQESEQNSRPKVRDKWGEVPLNLGMYPPYKLRLNAKLRRKCNRFFTEVLGCVVHRVRRPRTVYYTFNYQSQLLVEYSDDVEAVSSPNLVMTLVTRNIKELAERLINYGLEVTADPEVESFEFTAPGGVMFRVCSVPLIAREYVALRDRA